MMEILRFVFQDFWHFAGAVVLLSILISPINFSKITIGRTKKDKGDTKKLSDVIWKTGDVTWKKEIINGKIYNAGYNKDGERIFLEVL